MGRFRVDLSSRARKFYADAPAELLSRLNACFEALESDPYRGPNIKRLRMSFKERLYRYRIGDYRVIYEVFDDDVLVVVIKIAKREDVYKNI